MTVTHEKPLLFSDQAVKTGNINLELFDYLNQSQTIFFNCDHCFYSPTRPKAPWDGFTGRIEVFTRKITPLFFLNHYILYIHEQYIFRKNKKRASIVMKFMPFFVILNNERENMKLMCRMTTAVGNLIQFYSYVHLLFSRRNRNLSVFLVCFIK